MTNVWTSVAVRALSAAPTIRAKRVLEVFNGHATSQTTRHLAHRSTRGRISHANGDRKHMFDGHKTAFSTSSCLAARPKKAAPENRPTRPPAQKKAETAQNASRNAAKLQPAQTVASHTEGLPAGNDTEQLTWRDYDPAGGMPLPGGERTHAQINAIFQDEKIDVDTGNYILSVMHWRRMSGALIDVGLDMPKNSAVTPEQARKGLEYVRSIMPRIDEVANGQVWAEEEQQRLREEIQARAVKLGLYKAQEGAEVEAGVGPEPLPEEEQQGTPEGRARTGESVLVQVRKANESAFEIWKAEKERRETQMQEAAIIKARGPLELAGGVMPVVHSVQVTTQVQGPLGLKFNLPKTINIGPPRAGASLAPVERKPWVKYYEEQATIIKDNAIPQMSTFKRIAPSFLLLFAVLAGCYYLSENYTPPPKSARVWPETPPAAATLYAITGLLVATFFMGRIPPLWRMYSKYMTVVPAYPYALSIIGATFRHDTVAHLASNLVSLWLFGLMLHDDVGRGTFLAIYLASGTFGAFSSLIYNVGIKQWMAYIFGASGAVLGVAAAACTLHPNRTLTLFGYDVPIAAWVFLALFGGSEALAAITRAKTIIDHAGHLGGIAMGIVAAGALRMRTSQQQSTATQQVDTLSSAASTAGSDVEKTPPPEREMA